MVHLTCHCVILCRCVFSAPSETGVDEKGADSTGEAEGEEGELGEGEVSISHSMSAMFCITYAPSIDVL